MMAERQVIDDEWIGGPGFVLRPLKGMIK